MVAPGLASVGLGLVGLETLVLVAAGLANVLGSAAAHFVV